MATSIIDKALQAILKMLQKKDERVLLWENASPNSAFAPQTLTVTNLSSYQNYMILYRFHTTLDMNLTESAEVGAGTIMNMCDAGSIYRRNVTYQANGLTISGISGTRVSGAADITDNKYLIHVKIYGIKFLSGGGTRLTRFIKSLFHRCERGWHSVNVR